MKVFHYDAFIFPLPIDHRFPVGKYPRLREKLLETGILSESELYVPEPATEAQLSLVHHPDYIRKVMEGRLGDREIRRLGLPWSPELVERARRSVGATVAVSRIAMQEGVAASLGGGTHHAYPDHGQGFCIFNDVAVAARVLQYEHLAQRIAVIDCDVHQGNGTAAIFRGDSSVFTFSIHGEKNFPFHKEKSDLDIALPDGTGDDAYLKALQEGLHFTLDAGSYDLAYYLAGADPFMGDRLGRMQLSKTGLADRDRLVLQTCQARRLPVAITMSGGYAQNVADITDIHAETIRISKILFGKETL